ncbi:universal stress protein [Pseudactinotalea suaedae]|uniref:universal stress protein n=1 Tax=Pseudactinotalea suaedae TaxID=1524924 RepID=UPI0012E1AE17|nr:universal stress protein [Pseudactinotalea suaedae]
MSTATITRDTRPILVGVDGSSTSVEALRTAGRLGAALNLPIRAVTTWVVDPGFGGYVPIDVTGPQEVAQEILDRALAVAFDGEPPVDLEAALVYGPAAPTLIEQSETASMMIVGSRGLGGFRGMLLGSVSVACVHHAHCPVLVIRPEERTADSA